MVSCLVQEVFVLPGRPNQNRHARKTLMSFPEVRCRRPRPNLENNFDGCVAGILKFAFPSIVALRGPSGTFFRFRPTT